MHPTRIFLAIFAIGIPLESRGDCNSFSTGFENTLTEAISRNNECGSFLPDTGVLICGMDTANDAPCPQPGYPQQDGDYGRDFQYSNGTLVKIGDGIAGFDYTKLDINGNALPSDSSEWNCVRDNINGLVWEYKRPEALHWSTHSYTWWNPDPLSNAGNPGHEIGDDCPLAPYCNTGNLIQRLNEIADCGYDDWRLPTLNELLSIAYFEIYGFGNVDPGFLEVQGASYLTDEPIYGQSNKVFSVGMINGSLTRRFKDEQSSVIAVRGHDNSIYSSLRFLKSGTNLIYDVSTGLQWTSCVVGMGGNLCSDGAVTKFIWKDALQFADSIIIDGFSDWRLPNIKELASIVSTKKSLPFIDDSSFPNFPSSEWIWTSTPDVQTQDDVWAVYFHEALSHRLDKTTARAILLVRDFNR